MRHRVATALVLAASANSNPWPVEMQNEEIIYCSTSAVSGTTPTLDIKVQISPDQGATWFDSGYAFTQQTANGTAVLKIPNNLGTFQRLVFTLGGTTPSFTVDVWAEGKRIDG